MGRGRGGRNYLGGISTVKAKETLKWHNICKRHEETASRNTIRTPLKRPGNYRMWLRPAPLEHDGAINQDEVQEAG